MELEEYLQEINRKYYEEQEESYTFAIEALKQVHVSVADDPEMYEEFREIALYNCGGAYLPFLFWSELSVYCDSRENRLILFQLLKAFADSDFSDEMIKDMKPLIITYIAMETEFEIDRLKAQIIDKAHPNVQSYFKKYLTFVEKNKDSVGTYTKKFNLIRKQFPDFELLSKPLSRVYEVIEGK